MRKLSTKVLTIMIGLVLLTAACASQQNTSSAPQASATAVQQNISTSPTTGSTITQPGASTTQADGPATTQASSAGATGQAPSTSSTTSAESSGTTVYQVVSGKNTAGYRVREQLASLNFPSDAVGKTQDVSGSIVIKSDGTIDSSASKIVVNLSTLQSDKSMRDNFLRRNVLDTTQYPNATFVPTQISGLQAPYPQTGDVNFKLTGNLTIQNTTKPVTWDVTGKVQNGEVTGKATTSFTFEDFNLTQPRVPVVLSVQDHIGLELDFDLQAN